MALVQWCFASKPVTYFAQSHIKDPGMKLWSIVTSRESWADGVIYAAPLAATVGERRVSDRAGLPARCNKDKNSFAVGPIKQLSDIRSSRSIALILAISLRPG